MPPEQRPSRPLKLPEMMLPIGFVPSTPEYRDATMAELRLELGKVAVTGPSPLGVPCAIHTSVMVVPRLAHCFLTRVQVSPRPETPLTFTLPLVEIEAR